MGPQEPSGAVGTTDVDKSHNQSDSKASMHVIVLGPTGGPREDRVTGILVRSLETNWASNSVVAVDAGTLLCGIIHVLSECDNEKGVLTSGPFAGLHLPHKSIPANAAYIFQKIVGTVLITHPHLDHVSALAINTPVLEAGNGPKTVAALPSVVDAIKSHVFNDVIWPNLSDEDGGVGLITYQRLVEGGNPILGRGDERGYVRACDGLLARCFGVSHGRCKPKTDPGADFFRRASSAIFSGSRLLSVDAPVIGTPSGSHHSSFASRETWTTVESSAFFIRDQHSGNEIIIFGDVEPDSISLDPRNRKVWEVATPKVISRQLRAIFIECSYSDKIEDVYLFGHLCPRHLIEELSVLARFVAEAKGMSFPTSMKRKRVSSGATPSTEPVSPKTKRGAIPTTAKHSSYPTPRRTRRLSVKINPEEAAESSDCAIHTSPVDSRALRRELINAKNTFNTPKTQSGAEMPLAGLSIYVIHVKDDMTDGPHPGEKILQELNELGQKAGLGCVFHVPKRGESIYL